jgi:hypothetical protein
VEQGRSLAWQGGSARHGTTQVRILDGPLLSLSASWNPLSLSASGNTFTVLLPPLSIMTIELKP